MTSEERIERPERSGPPGDGGDRPPRGDGRPQRPRFSGRRKVCRLCADHMEGIDYKDIGRLRMYVSDRGKIEPRRKTGACQKHQRLVATAVKRARHLALLPYTLGHIRTTGVFPSRG
jgi:small subunit ribosomal protein S18